MKLSHAAMLSRTIAKMKTTSQYPRDDHAPSAL